MRTPTLQTADLELRPLVHATRQAVQWMTDPLNMTYSEQRHRKHTLASEQAYVRAFDHVQNHIWVIRRLEDNAAVGNITAHRDFDNGIGDIGILIDHNWWRRGYGSQAWSAVMDYLLRDMRKIEAGTRSDNLGMRRVMEQTGMSFEGERPDHFVVDGKAFGLVMYGKLA